MQRCGPSALVDWLRTVCLGDAKQWVFVEVGKNLNGKARYRLSSNTFVYACNEPNQGQGLMVMNACKCLIARRLIVPSRWKV